MNPLEKKGKSDTYKVFASVLLVSVHTIVSYNLLLDNVALQKTIEQVVRLLLTLVLMFFVLSGRHWAVVVFTVLFSLGAVGGLVSLFVTDAKPVASVPIIVMVLIYTYAAYFFNYSDAFKAYFSYVQQKKGKG